MTTTVEVSAPGNGEHAVVVLRERRHDADCLPLREAGDPRADRLDHAGGLIRQYYVGTSRMNALRRDETDGAFPGLLDVLTAQRAATR